jgi:hypothetical protein
MPNWSSSHFEFIAAMVAEIADEKNRREIAKRNSVLFSHFNSRFNCDRFMSACKVEPVHSVRTGKVIRYYY